MYHGRDDQAPKFIKHGYWLLGWKEKDAHNQIGKRGLIVAGDRIAIKRMMGQGASKILITALGIVTDVDKDDKDRRVYVNWAATDLRRVVDAHGALQAISGPFEPDNEWIREVFQL
jgi:hypothetical protein